LDRVSSIVRQGRGKLVWDNGEVAHYQTELSEMLDEPDPPATVPFYRPILACVGSLLVLLLVLLVIAGVQAQTYVDVSLEATNFARKVALGWFGLLIPLAVGVQFVRVRLAQSEERITWAHAHRRWSSLYYCSRDDIIFAPTLSMVTSPRDMRSLLYPSESITDEGVQQLAAGGLWETAAPK
jgi:hypothetical protein